MYIFYKISLTLCYARKDVFFLFFLQCKNNFLVQIYNWVVYTKIEEANISSRMCTQNAD